MQKLLKRTAQAEKQAGRRKAKRADIRDRAKLQDEFKKRMSAVTLANRNLVAARRRRREDWELGPLAPRRDTPVRGADGAYWGSSSLAANMSALGGRQRGLACRWAGGAKFLCLKAGDRVAVMQGPDKGKIGTIRAVEMDEAQLSLEGDNLQHNVTLSEQLVNAELSEELAHTQLGPFRVPIQAVRLIHPLRDEQTGTVRDAIINELQPFNIIHDKPTKRTTWSRLVPGLNVEIPWPRAFEEAQRNELEQVFEDNEYDTSVEAALDKTFLPSLLRPPMPAEIIDELRNKYSKFRTRHDPEYIARKEQEAAAKVMAKHKTLDMLHTPLKELGAKLKADRMALGREPELTDAMLEKIGEFMLRAQQAKGGMQVEVKAPTDGVQTKAERLALEKADAQAKLEKIQIQLRYMSKKKKATEETRLKATEARLKSILSELSAESDTGTLRLTVPPPSGGFAKEPGFTV